MSSVNDVRKSANIVRVVHITREFRGLAGAGGIKDVAEGLAKAAAASGIDTHVFLPYYAAIDNRKTPLHMEETAAFGVAMNYPDEKRTEAVAIRSVSLQPKLTVHLVDSKRFKFLSDTDDIVKRQGIYTYTRDEAVALGRPELEGKGYYDFFAMNVLLVKAALHYLGLKNLRPDVIHCHDGHTALLPLIAQESEEDYAAFLHYTPSLITVHNAGMGYHQEIDDLDFARHICGVPERKRDVISGCLLEKRFDPLFSGGIYGTAINTVSENYARELQHTGQDWMTGWIGHALAGRGITLHGVTNGVDPESWNPEAPDELGLDASFSVIKGELKGKAVCKRRTIECLSRGEMPRVPAQEKKRLSLVGRLDNQPDFPLLTFIGRLDGQKGFDMLADALGLLLPEDKRVQVLGLGSGDPAIQKRFAGLAEAFPGRVCLAVGYSDAFAAKVYAAGDFFVIPSRFEPCGLTDFFAQLMGNLPIVHQVGGLVKTVDGRFGYGYLGGAEELLAALHRALDDYREPSKAKIRKMQIDSVVNIHENFTWQKVLEKKYLPLYRMAIGQMRPAMPF
jgi:starch synthase